MSTRAPNDYNLMHHYEIGYSDGVKAERERQEAARLHAANQDQKARQETADIRQLGQND